jgi:hypothetical protein
MVSGPHAVKLVGQLLAEKRIKYNLVQVMERKTQSEIIGKNIKSLAVTQRILDAFDSFFNFFEHTHSI